MAVNYCLESEITNETAIIEIMIPVIMFHVSGSPNIMVPTRIAVTGSNTPSTDALVAPILRVATARVDVETIVGNKASPKRLAHAAAPEMPLNTGFPVIMILEAKTIAPISRV